ncbi:DeoR/GlpR family DNA-binding transcription regulator [Frigidibacter sp.]|uniref:DeoR/GlpR family DNA-binding transcription regulator n=1 Tax=Frigidibacter sp. TaxID=2586418 RepID=UPI0027353E4C|nr:DeoR/GlpR family DNA-binding transcription regulator [Frigidibacter sp.]MDP3340025.1 DeoR/GlpR family DNA-binding transcription regulator [Frigidibacter sp.]
MKPKARQAGIAEAIGQEGQMSVEALADRFGVSAETIRRDLAQLAEGGLVQKVHGGAKRLRLLTEGSFQERMTQNAAAKRIIAEKLVQLVEPGDTLFIDTGSTTVIAAEALAPVGGFTVITNSLRIAQIFAAADRGNRVFLLGGGFNAGNDQTVGPVALAQIAAFQADHALLTVAGFDTAAGATDADFDESQIARAMIENADQVILLADSSKLGRKAAFRVCPARRVDMLVTEAEPDAALQGRLRAAEVLWR